MSFAPLSSSTPAASRAAAWCLSALLLTASLSARPGLRSSTGLGCGLASPGTVNPGIGTPKPADESPAPPTPGRSGPGRGHSLRTQESSGPGADVSATAKLDPSQRRAIDQALRSGLDFLSAVQAERSDGSWPIPEARRANQAPLAVTALSTLALMSGGSPPGRGPHGAEVARGIDHLLTRVALSKEDPARGYVGSSGDINSRMHGHGFATLALAEAYSQSPGSPRGRRIAESLPLAVDLIQRTQGSEGGWNYEPRVEVEHEGSVTICLVQALRAARNAGIAVDPDGIARAEDYVRRSQAPDGSFRYTLGSDQTSVALTAAAVATLEAVGRYDDPALIRGLEAIWRDLAQREADGDRSAFPYYERFYMAQALWQHPDRAQFDRWFADELQSVLASQEENGSWMDNCPYGRVYATAMNCLFLSVPLENLPIFTR